MDARRPQRPSIVAVVVSVASLVGCRVEEDDFWRTIYACDARDAEETCGTDREGRPMVCFDGRADGTDDFCAEACDEDGAADGGSVCRRGALVPRCRPEADRRGGRAGCPKGLTCFPTELVLDEGVCLRPCADRPDCIAPVESCVADDLEGTCRPIRGREAACFAAKHLGGGDFCTERCDVLENLADERVVCLKTPSGAGALIQTCAPTAADDDSAGCPFGLHCLRTNVLAGENEGLCLPVKVCKTWEDCQLVPDRPFCLGQLLKEYYRDLADTSFGIPTDHSQCIQIQTDSMDCPAGEAGLDEITSQEATNICIAGCDFMGGAEHRRPCPPNFTCAAETESPRTQPLCAPGLIGYRCSGERSCLAGDCVDTGAGFHVCSVPCDNDMTCAAFDAPAFRGPFACLGMPSGNHCLNAAPFSQQCFGEEDCPEDEHCSFYNPFYAKKARTTEAGGECRAACEDGRCRSRGSMPYACLPNDECHMGIAGVPCTSSDECAPGLSCASFDNETVLDRVNGIEPVRPVNSICTLPCDSSADCAGHPLTRHSSCLPAFASVLAETSALRGICIPPDITLP